MSTFDAIIGSPTAHKHKATEVKMASGITVEAAITAIGSPLQWKGNIATATFTNAGLVGLTTGWTYTVTATDGTTNTDSGTKFGYYDEIAWNGSVWIIIGNDVSSQIFSKNYTTGFELSGLDNLDSQYLFDHAGADPWGIGVSWLGARTFAIRPLAPYTSYRVYLNGKQYAITTLKQVTIPNVSGLYFVSLDTTSLTLSQSTVGWDLTGDAKIPVALVLMDATNNRSIVFEERHGISWDKKIHEYAHETFGTRYATGLRTVTGSWSGIANTFSVDSGELYDEDIELTYAVAQTTCYLAYRDVTATSIIWDALGSAPFKKSGTNIQYDNAGTLTDLAANSYAAYFVLHANALNQADSNGATYKPFIIVGQRSDVNLTNAQNNNTRESLLLPNFPLPEGYMTWRVIIRNNTPTYSIDLLDYRRSTTAGSPAVGSTHNSLAGRSDANSHPDSAIGLTDAGSYVNSLVNETTQNGVNDRIDERLDTFYRDVNGTRTGAATFQFPGTENCTYKYLESLFTSRSAPVAIGTGADGLIDNDGGEALITLASHGRLDGDVVYLDGTLTGTNFSANTPYFVKKKDANGYYLCTTLANLVAGTTIDYAADGVAVTVANLHYGWLSAITHSAGTCTATVISSEDLGASETTFRVSTYLKADRFVKEFRTGAIEVLGDAGGAQGTWYNDSKQHCYILPTDLSVGTAATDAGAAVQVILYADATAMNTPAAGGAWDLDAATELLSQRTDLVRTIKQGENFTMRVSSSAGATKAAKLQVRCTIVPIGRFLNT